MCLKTNISQTSSVQISRIHRIKKAKFLVHCFYMNASIYGEFQIYVSVFLIYKLSVSKCTNFLKNSHILWTFLQKLSCMLQVDAIFRLFPG